MTRALHAALDAPLARAGFVFRATRTAWRHHADRIDVLHLPSFDRALADGCGVTTFSFTANLGCYLRYVPPWGASPPSRDGLPLPAEHDCHFRGELVPRRWRDRRQGTIWSVAPDAANLPRCVEDVAQQLPRALAWYERFADPRAVLAILRGGRERKPGMWGYGAPGSPVRACLTGYVAHALGDDATARAALGEALASGCFAACFASVDEALAKAGHDA